MRRRPRSGVAPCSGPLCGRGRIQKNSSRQTPHTPIASRISRARTSRRRHERARPGTGCVPRRRRRVRSLRHWTRSWWCWALGESRRLRMLGEHTASTVPGVVVAPAFSPGDHRARRESAAYSTEGTPPAGWGISLTTRKPSRFPCEAGGSRQRLADRQFSGGSRHVPPRNDRQRSSAKPRSVWSL